MKLLLRSLSSAVALAIVTALVACGGDAPTGGTTSPPPPSDTTRLAERVTASPTFSASFLGVQFPMVKVTFGATGSSSLGHPVVFTITVNDEVVPTGTTERPEGELRMCAYSRSVPTGVQSSVSCRTERPIWPRLQLTSLTAGDDTPPVGQRVVVNGDTTLVEGGSFTLPTLGNVNVELLGSAEVFPNTITSASPGDLTAWTLPRNFTIPCGVYRNRVVPLDLVRATTLVYPDSIPNDVNSSFYPNYEEPDKTKRIIMPLWNLASIPFAIRDEATPQERVRALDAVQMLRDYFCLTMHEVPLGSIGQLGFVYGVDRNTPFQGYRLRFVETSAGDITHCELRSRTFEVRNLVHESVHCLGFYHSTWPGVVCIGCVGQDFVESQVPSVHDVAHFLAMTLLAKKQREQQNVVSLATIMAALTRMPWSSYWGR